MYSKMLKISILEYMRHTLPNTLLITVQQSN